MAYKVLKPISANNGMIPTGEIVDASEWKNVASLVAGRFLVEIIPEDGVVKSAKPKNESKPKAPAKPKNVKADKQPARTA